ncbi:hypothetical protein D3C73_834510 [compost metagenome]
MNRKGHDTHRKPYVGLAGYSHEQAPGIDNRQRCSVQIKDRRLGLFFGQQIQQHRQNQQHQTCNAKQPVPAKILADKAAYDRSQAESHSASDRDHGDGGTASGHGHIPAREHQSKASHHSGACGLQNPRDKQNIEAVRKQPGY